MTKKKEIKMARSGKETGITSVKKEQKERNGEKYEIRKERNRRMEEAYPCRASPVTTP